MLVVFDTTITIFISTVITRN